MYVSKTREMNKDYYYYYPLEWCPAGNNASAICSAGSNASAICPAASREHYSMAPLLPQLKFSPTLRVQR